MKILLSTVIFPNRFETNRGVYIKKQAVELARNSRLSIIVPVPYFPRFLKSSSLDFYARIPREDTIEGLPVKYPRFFIIPKIFRFLHGPFLFLSVVRFYHRTVVGERPDVLLGFWTFPDGFANVLMARLFRLPVVIGCLGSDVNQLAKPFLQRKMISWTLRNCNQVIAVSEALKTEIVERLHVPPKRVTVIPNGIEEGKFLPQDRDKMRQLLGLDRERRIAVCVARLEPVKGVDILVRAFSRVRTEGKLLVVVGDGGEMPHLQALVEELGISDSVSLVGAKPHEEIPCWIGAADLVVLPSISEGWPNVLMEAFSCGKAVVASRVGGVPEIVNAPTLGILVPPGDEVDLAKGIEEGLERHWDPEIIRARVKGRGWDVVAQELRGELKKVVECSSDRGST